MDATVQAPPSRQPAPTSSSPEAPAEAPSPAASTPEGWVPAAITRDPRGYVYKAVASPTDGADRKLTAAFAGSSATAAFGDVVETGSQSELLDAPVVAFVAAQGGLFAATSDPDQPGTGHVLFRGAGSSFAPSWNAPHRDVAVAALGDQVYAVSGEPGSDASVALLAAGSEEWRNVGSLAGFIPVSATAANGEVWFGGTYPGPSSSDPRLYHGGPTATFEPVALPASAYAQTTTVSALATANGSVFFALESRDLNSGVLEGGTLEVVSQGTATTIATVPGDAFVALAPMDGTLYALTVTGHLFYVSTLGRLVEDTEIPASSGGCVLAAGSDLYVGLDTQEGGVLFQRCPQ